MGNANRANAKVLENKNKQGNNTPKPNSQATTTKPKSKWDKFSF